MEEILNDNELIRYNRQINLKEIDIEGQERLKQSRVLVIGVGGLGCSVTQYLAAAGIGEMTIVDFDVVSLSNLQRQILYTDKDISREKVLAAKQALEDINHNIIINTINNRLSLNELCDIVTKYDVVIDCSDNLACRKNIDIACEQHKTPLVSGAAIRFEGQVSVFTYKNSTTTYRSLSQLFGEQQLSCSETGVVAPIVGLIGSIQALEAIKVILQIGELLDGRLLLIDGLSMKIREFKLPL